jgi:hypothetical protein
MTEQLYYPCIGDCKSARIIRRVSTTPMTFDDATEFLKKHYPEEWKMCDAKPQRVNLAVFVASDLSNANPCCT